MLLNSGTHFRYEPRFRFALPDNPKPGTTHVDARFVACGTASSPEIELDPRSIRLCSGGSPITARSLRPINVLGGTREGGGDLGELGQVEGRRERRTLDIEHEPHHRVAIVGLAKIDRNVPDLNGGELVSAQQRHLLQQPRGGSNRSGDGHDDAAGLIRGFAPYRYLAVVLLHCWRLVVPHHADRHAESPAGREGEDIAPGFTAEESRKDGASRTAPGSAATGDLSC